MLFLLHSEMNVEQKDNGATFGGWIESSGFTARELAMAQPTITETVKHNQNRVDLSYGIGSALLTSVNILYLTNDSTDPWLFIDSASNHWFGLAAGGGSFLLGALNLDNTHSYLEPIYSEELCLGINCPPFRKVTITNQARTALALANIGVGFISIVRSGYYLIKKTEKRPSKTSFGVTQLKANPIQSGETVPALQLRVRF